MKTDCKCRFCKEWFSARISDRKRGWAKCCSKSCAAKLRLKGNPPKKAWTDYPQMDWYEHDLHWDDDTPSGQ